MQQCRGGVLVFEQKYYGEFGFSHRIFAQKLVCHPNITDVIISVLVHIGSDIEMLLQC